MEEESTAVPLENQEEEADPSLVTPKLSDNKNKYVTRLSKEGYRVDNNNDPAPENIPTPAAKDDEVMYHVNTIYLCCVLTLVMALAPAHQVCW